MNIAEKLVMVSENVEKVYEAGKQSEYDRFWDAYQKNGNPQGYALAFAGSLWSDDAYNPKYDIVVYYTANQMYNLSSLTDTKVSIDVSDTLPSRGTVQMSGTFLSSKLVTIRKLIVQEKNTYSQTFGSCTALKNITFEGVIGRSLDIHWSTLLTADSLESIVTHLSDTVTGYTLTLPTTAEANYNAVHGDGAWSALVATKTNWTIAYA